MKGKKKAQGMRKKAKSFANTPFGKKVMKKKKSGTRKMR